MKAVKTESIIARNMTELNQLIKNSHIEKIVYEYGGLEIEDLPVEVALSEGRSMALGGAGRRRMMIFISDELWLKLVAVVIKLHARLQPFAALSDSTLLSFRPCGYEWSRHMFERYESGLRGRTYWSSSMEGIIQLVEIASKDNYPSRFGQPLFIMYSYGSGYKEIYTASVRDGVLRIHLPDFLIESIRHSLEGLMKDYM